MTEPTPEQFQTLLLQKRTLLQKAIRRIASIKMKQFPGFPTPADLTCGWCQVFAQAIHKAVPSAEIVHLDDTGARWLSGTYCHTVILWHGRCYDIECIEGAASTRELPFYKEVSRWNSPRRIAVKAFYRQCERTL